MVATVGSWGSTSTLGRTENRKQTERGAGYVGPDYQTPVTPFLHQGSTSKKFYNLLHKSVVAGTHVFKYMSLWGASHIQTTPGTGRSLETTGSSASEMEG